MRALGTVTSPKVGDAESWEEGALAHALAQQQQQWQWHTQQEGGVDADTGLRGALAIIIGLQRPSSSFRVGPETCGGACTVRGMLCMRGACCVHGSSTCGACRLPLSGVRCHMCCTPWMPGCLP